MEQQSRDFSTPAASSDPRHQTSDPTSGELVFELLGRPPSWNKAFRVNRRLGSVYMSKEAKDWKTYVEYAVRIAQSESGWQPREGLIAVHFWIYLNRPIDADNILKLTMDSIAKGIGVNDRWFLPRVIDLQTRHTQERIDVLIQNEG